MKFSTSLQKTACVIEKAFTYEAIGGEQKARDGPGGTVVRIWGERQALGAVESRRTGGPM